MLNNMSCFIILLHWPCVSINWRRHERSLHHIISPESDTNELKVQPKDLRLNSRMLEQVSLRELVHDICRCLVAIRLGSSWVTANKANVEICTSPKTSCVGGARNHTTR